jgi:hypothetical protein
MRFPYERNSWRVGLFRRIAGKSRDSPEINPLPAMIKRLVMGWVLVLATTLLLIETAHATRLKVYSFPKQIAPGQLAMIIFENPSPEVRSRAQCTAEKLIAWVKSDVPILRIEQNGKQIWTSLGSYQTVGDSMIASFMIPVALLPGEATLFLVNDRDASVPYHFTVISEIRSELTGIESGHITPLGTFRVFGTGFVPNQLLDNADAQRELDANIGYSKMEKPAQWTAMNHRMEKDWDKLGEGNFLYLEQAGKTWRSYVEGCGITPQGLSLDFNAPPDLKPGPVAISMSVRMGGKEVTRTNKFIADVQ